MTWKLIETLINKKNNNRSSISKLINNNNCYTDKISICNQLNSHFINIGPNLAEKIQTQDNTDPIKYITHSLPNSFMFRAIHEHEVKDLIMALDLSKSTIGIPSRCIKLACNNISEALTCVYNQSLIQGIVPEALKISKVTPVDKGGEVFDPFNYRPISTRSCFTQVFEKLVYKQLLNHVKKYSILYQYQFGFQKGKSTEQAILEITDNLKNAIDNNLFTFGVFLDFAKAFDTVNHMVLLAKLEKYGVRGIPLQWFTSYLTNRQQYVSLGNVQSTNQNAVFLKVVH